LLFISKVINSKKIDFQEKSLLFISKVINSKKIDFFKWFGWLKIWKKRNTNFLGHSCYQEMVDFLI